MPASDLTLLIETALQAGELARGFVGGALDVQDKPDGAGPVTAADLAVNDMFEDVLRTARPDYGWLSEESTDSADRLTAKRVFVIDPIDGTRSFIEGGKTWSHSMAVVEDGIPVAAVVYLPMLNKVYSASLGNGARINSSPMSVGHQQSPDNANVLATKPSVDPRFWPRGVPGMTRYHRPSLAYRLSLVAEGRFDAMFTFRPSWEWDIAAGALILSEAGARVTDRRGAALKFNNKIPQTDGVLGANPVLHAAFLDKLG
ncbi:3'(2'),5'-bisphosphate nucleotidase CysQ [Pelagimonas varians]|uniref:Inositol-1-monophosphatase n=1 Tax=Pelagimonas varians TaxID=696760 RepID=A0A238K3I4_9RHOB|nr:3'(2'),5'-bisphosphate nucleotidase CysQ [Pelagimonas varians]PYG30492.1 myo-inositol-1(or 4)-monophosphatase [Pelagimonas varians]SMX37459.1 Inositol-1-monophosphatase [Pelagimonas varians]